MNLHLHCAGGTFLWHVGQLFQGSSVPAVNLLPGTDFSIYQVGQVDATVVRHSAKRGQSTGDPVVLNQGVTPYGLHCEAPSQPHNPLFACPLWRTM